MIPVTKPFLPPIDEYTQLLNGIWDRSWLTNMGPLANELERQLQDYLGVKDLLFLTNGTIALQFAIKALALKGEVITTPFSFVATASSIVWEGCTPVFVDIDPCSLNIDPSKIEAVITPNTSAILATHVYGNPCDVLAIQKIADKYNLKVIYDGAHAFGVEVNGDSIFNFGDVTTCSTHATKLYHTIEGGFVVSKHKVLIEIMASMRNFGFDGPVRFKELGINGKNSEFHAAMGLVNLKHMKAIHQKRKQLSELYDAKLKNLNITKPLWHSQSKPNYSYYPIIFKTEELLLKVKKELEANEIYGRRYFYPSLAKSLPYVDHSELKVTDDIAKRVFCLPFHLALNVSDVNHITSVINIVFQLKTILK